jgi:hypothetical protein
MNPTHLHLILNHTPVFGAVFGLAILAFGLFRNSQELKRVAMGVFVIAALLTIPVYVTGEPAEQGVKSFNGASGQLIEQHEQAATTAFIATGLLGALALTGLLLFRKERLVPVWFVAAMLLASVAVSSAMAWTAHLGGQIRHSEIRASASAPARSESD